MTERVSLSITIAKVVHDASTAQEARDLLLLPKPKGTALMIFVEGKFDGRKLAAVRNVGVNYPIEPIVLHNTAMLAATDGGTFAYYRDGFELFCLERAVQDGTRNQLFLLRGASMPSDQDVRRLEADPAPIKTSGIGEQQNIMVDCRSDLTREAISLAAEMYRSGAVLSLARQGIPNVLQVAIDALSKSKTVAGGNRKAEKFRERQGILSMWLPWVKSALAWASLLHGSRR